MIVVDVPEYLPIGSVITVKGSEKTLMIVGRSLLVDDDDQGKVYYDYSACFYPEGLIGDMVIYTNHECIETVVSRGYEDAYCMALGKMIQGVAEGIEVPKGHFEQSGEW